MAAADKQIVPSIRHPDYMARQKDWLKWRLVYAGGDDFVEQFLQKFSRRETPKDFRCRKESMTPIPTFAKTAINEIKNSIFQRMTDISRSGGSKTYDNAVAGIGQGVDLKGSTMNAFIGHVVLPELLTMGRVGVYVDMPEVRPGSNLIQTADLQPYVYMYRVEDILSWNCRDNGDPDEYQSVLLRDRCLCLDHDTYLVTSTVDRFRHLWIDPVTGKVNVQFYDKDGEKVDRDGNFSNVPVELDLTSIPLVMLDINQSLIEDVANHQIALLNLISSDVSYAIKANFPFYIEQVDTRAGGSHLKDGNNPSADAVAGGQQSREREIEVGPITGREYDLKVTHAPEFIHPSPEPLRASMELRKDLKEEIRQLVSLSLSNINPKMASAESKSLDMAGLESGLSFIGLVLENGERKISRYWSLYEKGKAATVKYPENYSLKSDLDRLEEAKRHSELMFKVPSKLFQKQVAKDIVTTLQGNKVSVQQLDKMLKEVDDAGYCTSDPDIIKVDRDSGLVGDKTASLARGYEAGEVEEAAKDHAARLKRIQATQAPRGGGDKNGNAAARGIADAGSPGDAAAEKANSRNADLQQDASPAVRGKGADTQVE
jgi:hypothetical protein